MIHAAASELGAQAWVLRASRRDGFLGGDLELDLGARVGDGGGWWVIKPAVIVLEARVCSLYIG